GSDRTVRLWSAAGTLRDTLIGHEGWVVDVAWRPDGRLLASASHDQTIKLWDPVTGQTIGTLRGHTQGIHNVVFSPDGRLLASADAGHFVKLWDVAKGQAYPHQLEGSIVAFRPDGRELATLTRQGVILWDATTGKKKARLPGPVHLLGHLAFSPDG